ncbi:MAG: hypothetical protein IPP72_13310 [Chitinophagaceae bacterium]|nr:hypothetical protein [Chitinophagaceae bacterium]
MNHQQKLINILSAGLILSMMISATGCYYDKEALLYPGSNQVVDCATISAKFSTDVSPLIAGKCATSGCHDATASGGLIFQNYTQVSSAKDRINIRAVVEKSMPSAAPLQPSEINIIKCWIESGAPNN